MFVILLNEFRQEVEFFHLWRRNICVCEYMFSLCVCLWMLYISWTVSVQLILSMSVHSMCEGICIRVKVNSNSSNPTKSRLVSVCVLSSKFTSGNTETGSGLSFAFPFIVFTSFFFLSWWQSWWWMTKPKGRGRGECVSEYRYNCLASLNSPSFPGPPVWLPFFKTKMSNIWLSTDSPSLL